MREHNPSIYEKYIKRFFDIVLSFTGIILLSPILLITAMLVRIKLGSPIIFKQMRPGKNEKVFAMYKFRSMTNQRNSYGELLPDELRLTAFGKKLRSTSLDELPELLNILKGDMSIVGPRPQLIKDMYFMNELERERHEAYPGLTGLAQVSGRNNIPWPQKLQYDLEYKNNITFLGDVNIVVKTIKKVFAREGTVREGTVSDIDLGDYLLNNDLISLDKYNEINEKYIKDM